MYSETPVQGIFKHWYPTQHVEHIKDSASRHFTWNFLKPEVEISLFRCTTAKNNDWKITLDLQKPSFTLYTNFYFQLKMWFKIYVEKYSANVGRPACTVYNYSNKVEGNAYFVGFFLQNHFHILSCVVFYPKRKKNLHMVRSRKSPMGYVDLSTMQMGSENRSFFEVLMAECKPHQQHKSQCKHSRMTPKSNRKEGDKSLSQPSSNWRAKCY